MTVLRSRAALSPETLLTVLTSLTVLTALTRAHGATAPGPPAAPRVFTYFRRAAADDPTFSDQRRVCTSAWKLDVPVGPASAPASLV